MDYIIHCILVSSPRPTRSVAHTTAMSSKRKWDQAAPEESIDDPESFAKVAKVDESKNASTAAAAAAAIAAKIAAQYSGAAAGSGGGLLGPKDIHDGEFAQDIDINDVRNRYMLTKGSTQQQVRHPSPIRDGHISRTPVSIFLLDTRRNRSFRQHKRHMVPRSHEGHGERPPVVPTHIREHERNVAVGHGQSQ
jgi:hypothetical protein